MSKRVDLIASQEVRHERRVFETGAPFRATPTDAKYYVAHHRATYATRALTSGGSAPPPQNPVRVTKSLETSAPASVETTPPIAPPVAAPEPAPAPVPAETPASAPAAEPESAAIESAPGAVGAVTTESAAPIAPRAAGEAGATTATTTRRTGGRGGNSTR